MEARRSRLIIVDTWSPSLHAGLSYETLVQSNTVLATIPGLSVQLAQKKTLYKNSTSVLFTLWRNKALACLTQVEKLIRRDYYSID